MHYGIVMTFDELAENLGIQSPELTLDMSLGKMTALRLQHIEDVIAAVHTQTTINHTDDDTNGSTFISFEQP